MIRQFGLLLAVGIAAICLVQHHRCRSPSLGIREYKSPTKAQATSARASLGRLIW